eukprot:6214749-Pleurochrysis_carterae.AAC.6
MAWRTSLSSAGSVSSAALAGVSEGGGSSSGGLPSVTTLSVTTTRRTPREAHEGRSYMAASSTSSKMERSPRAPV